MFVMVTMMFPPAKGTEVGKVFTSGKLPELPSFVKLLHIFLASAGENKTYAIYEVENEKAYEGFMAIANRYVPYSSIEGLKSWIEPVLTPEEGLPMLGLAPLK